MGQRIKIFTLRPGVASDRDKFMGVVTFVIIVVTLLVFIAMGIADADEPTTVFEVDDTEFMAPADLPRLDRGLPPMPDFEMNYIQPDLEMDPKKLEESVKCSMRGLDELRRRSNRVDGGVAPPRIDPP